MSTINEMRAAVAKLVTNAQAEMSGIKDDTPAERAAEIESTVDAMLAEAGTLEGKIARQEKIDDAQRRVEQAFDDDKRKRRPNGGDGSVRGADDGEAITYRSAFHEYMSHAGQLGAMSPEARAVLSAGFAKADIAPENRAQTSSATAGGYLIPEEMRPELIRSMLAWGPMYNEDICTVLTTASGAPIPIPTVNDTAVTAVASTEGATLTDDAGSDVTFGEKQLDAFSFDTEWIRVSLELAQDSALAMETLLAALLGERLGRIANLRLTTGTGSSQPNGIVTASTAGKTAAAVAALTMDEVLDFEHSVDPAYRAGPKVRYMFNDSTLLSLRKLKDGDGNYLWQMGNVQAGVPNTFNDKPYSINQAMDSLAASKKVMLFGDFSKYFVRKVGAPLIGAIQDKDFWPGFGVAGYIRFDGELTDTAAVKHLITAAS